MLSPAVAQTLPFACVLLLIAIVPQLFHDLWEDARKRFVLMLSVACIALAFDAGRAHLFASLSEYFAFLALISTLFVVSGGIAIEGFLGGTPLRNTVFLAVGSVLASLIGTTGAAMLLIRPFLRANVHRAKRTHLLVFFIILVGNVGGLLLPMGDPPLFMGYLRGVPFFWTLSLWPTWALIVGASLVLFCALDTYFASSEPLPPITQQGVGIRGRTNLLLLVLCVLGLIVAGHFQVGPQIQSCALLAVALLSFWTTPEHIHRVNQFSLSPMLEVATVFLAIFITLPPATESLAQMLGQNPVIGENSLFWGVGLASSILDNAPCYLASAGIAASSLSLPVDTLLPLSQHPQGRAFLAAISEGAVTMGALTYIGNGPNLLVRGVAEHRGMKVPSFFGYTLIASAILLPILALSRVLTH